MATKIASLYAEIGADTSKLDAGLKSTKTGLKQTDDGIGGITKSLKGMAATMGVAFGAATIVNFAKQSISAASDLNETMSKSSVVFGDAADSIEAMGNTAASALGMSKNEAVAAAATYGNLFVSMGLASDKSADMSKNMVQLAADLGSFNNLPTADVLEKLRAGLTGEAEPLKSLGININEVMLKQEALNLGLWNGKGVLDAATKAQAAYSLMLKQSTTAQGDFARTADGVANQTKILESKTADLTAELGKKLLPAWKLVLETGVDALDNLGMLVEMTNNYTNVLADHDKDVQKTAKSYQDYVDEMVRAAKAADIMVDAQGNIRNGWGFVIDKLDLVTEAEFNANQQIIASKKALDDTHQSAVDAGGGFDEFSSSVGASSLKAQDFADILGKNASDALTRVNTLMQSYTVSLLYNQASTGLDADAALLLATSLGLVDQSTVTAMNELDLLKGRFDSGQMSARDYAQQVSELGNKINLLKDKSVTISTYYKTFGGGEGVKAAPAGTGSVYAHASGGSWTIPPGYNENYPVSPGHVASSGETVTVTPAGSGQDFDYDRLIIGIRDAILLVQR